MNRSRGSFSLKQLAFDLAQPALPTLDNFVIGRNAELVQRLKELVHGAGSERVFYLWGARGCGRTHLLRATIAALRSTVLHAAYVSHAAGLDSATVRDAQALAVDDVERLDEAAQIALFRLYNRLREEGGVLLAAGSAPPAQLKLRDDVVTRLAWGLVYEVHALSD